MMGKNQFRLVSPFTPTAEQASVAAQLEAGVRARTDRQTLLGVTGSGKTLTMAIVVAALNLPTLILTHNKTLGTQLHSEFQDLFPHNAVYFLHSPYRFYRPTFYSPELELYRDKLTRSSPESREQWDIALGDLNHRRDVLIVATSAALFAKGHLVADPARPSLHEAIAGIREELQERVIEFRGMGKPFEAAQLQKIVNADILKLEQSGSCKNIQFYSRHLDGRSPGQRPRCLLDFFPENRLLFIDESHVVIPQLRAMEPAVRDRVQNLVGHGFALPSAFDARPITLGEFEELARPVVYVSATPGDYELSRCNGHVAEQVLRPTGLVDPFIEVRATEGQTAHLVGEIRTRAGRGERSIISVVTTRMAEYVSDHLNDLGIRAAWLHGVLSVEDRNEVLIYLRGGELDAVVGVNLLREGLDLPEVSFVAILNADEEGFLRSERSLIQMVGRAARHVNGKAVLYADQYTPAMRGAIAETNRRRQMQIAHNELNNIQPRSIEKPVRL